MQIVPPANQSENLRREQQISVPTRLGWVSFFNDCSSEVISRALPLLLTAGLGMTPTFVGAVEGCAEAVSILLKGFSGWFSDRLTSRKPLVLFGYTLSVLSRMLMLAVHLPGLFALARIFDRTGKGMRTAPRDAMVADCVAGGMSGRAFGITRFLDTLGAMSGIFVVLVLGLGQGAMTVEMFRRFVWASLPFAVISLLVLIVTVPAITRLTTAKKSLSWHIPREIRGYLVAVVVFALGNSSDAFLVLRAKELGFSFRQILAILFVFNGLAAALAVPVGKLTDRIGRMRVLAFGWLIYAAAYFCFACLETKAFFVAALCTYGAFYGFTEGTEKALLADLLPPDKRGAGFGALQLVTGISVMPASLLTGWLMTTYGSAVAFYAASVTALCAVLALGVWQLLRQTD
jgi:MFS family permease